MAQYLYQTRISDHLAFSPEGYLICTGCVLCRSGTGDSAQQYRMSEIDESSNSDELVSVDRRVSEVTDPKFLASLPGKAFVVRHSAGLLTADTHAWSARGVILRAYVGDESDENGDTLVLGDVVVHDPDAIRRILAGERQLSVGYKYKLAQGEDGRLQMTNLVANHLALVEQGRAGNAQIMDSALSWGGGVNAETILPGGEGDEPMSAGARKAVAIDEPMSHEELINELIPDESEDEIPMPKTKTQTDEDDLGARVDRLCALIEQLLSRKAADDALVPVATLPKSERGENPIIGDLRRLRPAVQASGDRKAIDAFNTAMTAAKRGVAAPAQTLIAAYDRQPAGALSFEDMVRLRGREMREGGKLASEPTDYADAAASEKLALDSQRRTESYQDMIARVGREMQGAKFQRN